MDFFSGWYSNWRESGSLAEGEIRIPTLLYSADERPESAKRILWRYDKIEQRVYFSTKRILGPARMFALFGFRSWGICGAREFISRQTALQIMVMLGAYTVSWIFHWFLERFDMQRLQMKYVIRGRTFKNPPLALGCASLQSKSLPPIYTPVISYTTVL